MHRAPWKTAALALVATLVGVASGCFPEEQAAPADGPTRLAVVCTTGQVAELVARVGGPAIAVTALMGPGVDPHLYKPSHGDLRRLRGAEAVFYNGLHLEGRLGEVLEKLGRTKPVFAVTGVLEQAAADRLRPTSTAGGHYDPHVWFDLDLWGRCAVAVGEELGRLVPDQREAFAERARLYAAELAQVAGACRQRLAAIPPERRLLVTAHDAFEYFGRAFEIEVQALQGISTADEADLETLERLVRLLAERQVKAIFVESSVPAKYVEAVVEGCSARGHRLTIGGELYSDALGPTGSPAETLAGMIRHNVDTIVTALR